VRIFAARALGRRGIHEAALALSTRLDAEGDQGVKNELAAALRMLSTRDSLSKLVDRALPKGEQGRLAVYEGLDLLQADGLADRLVALESSESDLFDAAVGAVREHRGGALVPLLIVLLDSDSIENRQVAIKYLQAITRHTHGFKPEDSPGDRKKAVKEWERWWKQAGSGYAEEKR
ncbi:MAG: HEAT repeat domain-containing protein, partial [Planctomycetota bacterium]